MGIIRCFVVFGCALVWIVWLWLIAMVMCYPGADFGGLGLYVDYVFVVVGLVCCVDWLRTMELCLRLIV